ncbi:glycoside hydrolase family 3 C-terminal domain-containing protein [uncultured Cellulomonas sp.]|uniref:beta-glucosidase H n=1 Tax=uncultured Cellulomonas sp. TaxID=189682 RepID=UPI0028ED9C1A|nr:glycoside hydrolase family 3 C-terminal domain-containing protein [uncultured Cellulomonas sp.]
MSLVAVVCAAAMAMPVQGAAAAAGDDPDGEAAVTERLQEGQSLPSQWWWDESGSDTRRARALLRQMTLDEKVNMLHGELNNFYGFYNGPIERLGIPALTMADGPAGVRIANPDVNDQEATQLPAPIALAATWDTALAEQYGQVAGDEAFRTGHNVLLSPAVDIARVAQAGRAFEALGEDPLLSGKIAAAEIRGIQSHPVVADIKHYNVYTQETNRLSGGNAVVDERALQEIYTRPYAIGIEEGRPGSAMCAFNKVNGVFACESDELLNRILKEQLDFEGWVMSDYGATHSTVQAILAGMDQEMPGNTTPDVGPGTCFFCGPLLDAVRAGQVPVSRIDDAVLRILRPMFALGLFDNPPVISALPEAEHGAFARSVAERAMVLLKNEANALPLSGSVGSIAVIGADADTVVAGGGSSLVKPTYTVSPLEGIQARVGPGVLVRHVAGADGVTSASLIPGPDPIPSDFLTSALGDGAGLRAEYFSTADFGGPVLADRTDPYAAINAGFFLFEGFNAQSPHFPVQTRSMGASIRWTGTLTAPVDGTYELAVTTTGTATVYLDDVPVLTSTPSETPATTTAAVQLAAGVGRDLRVEFVNNGPGGTDAGAVFQLGWTTPEGVVAPQALAAADLARSSQAAVVVVRDYSSEGGDKPDLDLPNGQAELIRQVAAANPRTVVVLATGGAVQTSDWEQGVPAVVHSWFGGQEQGGALARILFGDVNPSGKLPITIPVDEDSTPVSSPAQYPGDGLDQQFSEGIYVGYRGYEELDITPQYAFGTGLSYTTFDYRNLRTNVAAGVGARRAGAQLQVKVAVRNTGTVAGTETVQVYVGNLPTRQVQSAPKVLAGWATVTLQPGERQQVTVTLSPESVSYWDVDRDRWRTPRGDIPVYVGSSSADIRLTGTLRVGGRALP